MLKIYKTQAEVEKDIKNGVLAIEGDVKFECSISISASIVITAGDITAGDITARDINARDINAGDILYFAFCCVYNSIKCMSIKADRANYQKPICLDGKLEIKQEGKMEYKIKNRYTNKIIVEGEAESFKEFVIKNKTNLRGADLREADLREADLREADLWGADLRGADLRGANLREADLREADLRGVKIKITQKEEILIAIGIKIEEEK